MVKEIWLDCDGTWIDLYGVNNWLEYLINEDSTPYEIAKPLVNLTAMAQVIHKLQHNGYKVGIISWLSKNSTVEYDAKVTAAKMNWFAKHIPSVVFDEIHIVKYGTPKQIFASNEFSILFDDEEKNRTEWTGIAYNQENLVEMLNSLV